MTHQRGTDVGHQSVEAVLGQCGAERERETLQSAIDLRLVEARLEEQQALAYERALAGYESLAHSGGEISRRSFTAHANASRRLMMAHRARSALCLEEVRILVRHRESCRQEPAPHS